MKLREKRCETCGKWWMNVHSGEYTVNESPTKDGRFMLTLHCCSPIRPKYYYICGEVGMPHDFWERVKFIRGVRTYNHEYCTDQYVPKELP